MQKHLQWVVTLRHREELTAVNQQTVLQQRWHRQEHPAARHVLDTLELDGHPVERAHRCGDAIERAGGCTSQRRLAVGYAALALGARATLSVRIGTGLFF